MAKLTWDRLYVSWAKGSRRFYLQWLWFPFVRFEAWPKQSYDYHWKVRVWQIDFRTLWFGRLNS